MINMKKMSKKVVGTVLAAAMTMSMAVSAFAATPDTISVRFTDTAEALDLTEIVNTQQLGTGTHFQGAVLEQILSSSELVEGKPFVMEYGDQLTLLDVINKAATQADADPVYGATNRYEPNGIYIDSLFGKGTVNHYLDKDGNGKIDWWEGSYWNIQYQDTTGAPYAANYYANNELLENTPVRDISFTYVTDSMEIPEED